MRPFKIGFMHGYAVYSLYNPTAYHATLEISGPEALSPNQVVNIFETAGQRSFDLTYIPLETLQVKRKAVTDPLLQSWAGLWLSYARGESDLLQQQTIPLPSRLMTVEEYSEAIYAARRKADAAVSLRHPR
jgi:hypothetical protein